MVTIDNNLNDIDLRVFNKILKHLFYIITSFKGTTQPAAIWSKSPIKKL